jgi:hypothetical protein
MDQTLKRHGLCGIQKWSCIRNAGFRNSVIVSLLAGHQQPPLWANQLFYGVKTDIIHNLSAKIDVFLMIVWSRMQHLNFKRSLMLKQCCISIIGPRHELPRHKCYACSPWDRFLLVLDLHPAKSCFPSSPLSRKRMRSTAFSKNKYRTTMQINARNRQNFRKSSV